MLTDIRLFRWRRRLDDLDMSPFLSPLVQESLTHYELASVINHHGGMGGTSQLEALRASQLLTNVLPVCMRTCG